MCVVIALVGNKFLSEEVRRAGKRPKIPPVFPSLHSWLISVCEEDGVYSNPLTFTPQ